MATKIPGYHGQLLEIDLTAKSVKTVDLDPKLARDYIGGRAMGGKMLLDAYGTELGEDRSASARTRCCWSWQAPFVGFHRLQDELRLQVAAVARHRRRAGERRFHSRTALLRATTGSSSRGRPARRST